MVNIHIAGHNDFRCPVGRTVDEAVNAIRSMYGLIYGGIERNGEAMFPNDEIPADGEYHFVNFQSQQAPVPSSEQQQEYLKISVVLKLGGTNHPFEIVPLDVTKESAEQQVAEYFERIHPRALKKFHYDHFQLTNSKNQRVVVTRAIDPEDKYYFSLPRTILVESASAWKGDKLELLGIDIETSTNFQSALMTEFSIAINPEVISSLEEETCELTKSLKSIKFESKLDSETMVLDELTPVEKAVLVMRKYPEVEAAVDLMVTFLFQLCGFYKKQLFAFPQFPFKIQFGERVADAKPDFTIFDLKTYYRIAVVEDKSQWNSTSDVDVEAQLMAEAIAMAQANREKTGERHSTKRQAVSGEIVLGIRVRGTSFTFYLIPVTEAVLEAMNSCTSATKTTTVTKTQSLDLLDESDKRSIILFLLFYRVIAEKTGNKSVRRDSLAKRH